MSRATSDYAPLEERYVTGDMSIRELAHDVGKSWSTVAAWARKHEWAEKRASYRSAVATRAMTTAMEASAIDAATIREENIAAMRATVYEYVDNLKAHKVHVGTKEVTLAIDRLLLLMGEATERKETRTVDSLGDDISAEDLRDIVRLARARAVAGGVAEPT